jgi:hypothetical protein
MRSAYTKSSKGTLGESNNTEINVSVCCNWALTSAGMSAVVSVVFMGLLLLPHSQYLPVIPHHNTMPQLIHTSDVPWRFHRGLRNGLRPSVATIPACCGSSNVPGRSADRHTDDAPTPANTTIRHRSIPRPSSTAHKPSVWRSCSRSSGGARTGPYTSPCLLTARNLKYKVDCRQQLTQ